MDMINFVEAPVRAALRAILASGAEVYLVGGAVRDHLLGRVSKDQDFLVCGMHMDRLADLLSALGTANVVGQSFGVLKYRPFGSDREYDFALPRSEKSTGVGHKDFEVVADPFMSVETDLSRRDFSINSIAMDVETGRVIDPFGGVEDCRNKVLRLTFPHAFHEDPLRMLRAIQFAARFGLQFDPALSASMKRHAGLIKTVSPERVAGEFCKLLTAPKPSAGLKYMYSHGLLALIMPELADQAFVGQPSKYHRYNVMAHCFMACDDIPVGGNKNRLVYLRLTALLHDIGKKATRTFKEDGTPTFLGHDEVGADMARVILERLRFSAAVGYNIPVDRIVFLIRNHMFNCSCDDSAKTKRKFLARTGRDFLFDQIRLRIADRSAKGQDVDVSEWVTFARQVRVLGHGVRAAFDIRSLAVNGNDIMKHLGIRPGKQVGVILNNLFQAVLDDPALNDRDILLGLSQKY